MKEKWVVVVNKNEYELDEKQARVLSDAIASGTRGIVQFKDFIISVPFIEEFYLVGKWQQPEQLEEPKMSNEQRQKELIKIEKTRQKLLKTPDISRQLVNKYCDDRKKELERNK